MLQVLQQKSLQAAAAQKNLEIKSSQETIKVSPTEILKNSTQKYFEINEAAQIMRISRSIRQRQLANSNYTLYLDMYWEGQREYDYLNLYVKKSNNPNREH